MGFSLKRVFRKSYAFRSLYWAAFLNWIDLAAKLTRPGSTKKKSSIAFVKMDGIGDYVIWTAAFKHLRELYPSDTYERILIGNDRFEGLAEHEPTFDRKLFVGLERLAVSPLYRFRIMKQVRSLDADIIVNARSARDLIWSDSIVRCSAAVEKIGSEGTGNLMGPLQEKITRSWYTTLHPAPVKGEHELITNLKFLGVPESDISLAGTLDSVPGDMAIPGPYAVFFLGAQILEKCWPAENFGRAAEIISQRHGLKIVLCGGPADRSLVDRFIEASTCDHIDLVGKTSLGDFTGLLRLARLVVSNDTGAAHIAAMAGTPTVVAASGNEVGRYFPYPRSLNMNVKAIQYPDLCMTCDEACSFSRWSETATRPCVAKVTVEDVIRAAEELLSKTKIGNSPASPLI